MINSLTIVATLRNVVHHLREVIYKAGSKIDLHTQARIEIKVSSTLFSMTTNLTLWTFTNFITSIYILKFSWYHTLANTDGFSFISHLDIGGGKSCTAFFSIKQVWHKYITNTIWWLLYIDHILATWSSYLQLPTPFVVVALRQITVGSGKWYLNISNDQRYSVSTTILCVLEKVP